jgi:hypothetical protein
MIIPSPRDEKVRAKLTAKSQPLLPAGSTVHQIFPTQTGPNPLWLIVMFLCFPLALVMILQTQYWIVCVTDDAIHVLRTSLGLTPKAVAGTLPRGHQLGPVSGMWSQVELLGKRHWVHKRYHGQIDAADRERGVTPADEVEPPGPSEPT